MKAIGKLSIAYLACKVATFVFPSFMVYVHPELHGAVALITIFAIGVLAGMWVRSER